jgi:hypothetical protein
VTTRPCRAAAWSVAVVVGLVSSGRAQSPSPDWRAVDQERLLESELHRFVRFNWEVVTSLARAR